MRVSSMNKENNKTEYAIWGKSPKNINNEDLLATEILTKDKAKEIEQKLINNWGCFETRIQEIDFSGNFTEDFIKTIKRRKR